MLELVAIIRGHLLDRFAFEGQLTWPLTDPARLGHRMQTTTSMVGSITRR